MKRNSLIVLCICIVATLISIGLRYGALFSSSVFDYEWNTSTVMRHMTGWDREGGFAHGFVPMVSYGLPADKHINNHSSIEVGRPGYSDDTGSFYYVSYPPFAYIAPYALFDFMGVAPNVIGLRLFNILVQIATASLILLLLYRMTKSAYVGLLGYLLYLFTVISFYMHSVNYMSDMFVQVFFAFTAYLFYRIISRTKEVTQSTSISDFALLAGALALMVYSEWIGVFVCGFIFLYGLIYRHRYFSRVFMYMGACIPVLVLLGVTAQYATVADIPTFIYTMTDRYLHGYVPAEAGVTVWSQLEVIYNLYIRWFSPVFVATGTLLCLAVIGLLLSFKHIVMPATRTTVSMLLFFLVPVVLHHAVFFEWTAFEVHYYATLKTVPFFSVLIPLLVYVIWRSDFGKFAQYARAFALLVFVSIFVGSMSIYAYELETRTKGFSYGYCNVGTFMKENTDPDEIIFVEPTSQDRWNGIISSIIVLCAERNMELYTDMEAASELMRKNGTTKGVIYKVDYTDSILWLVDHRDITALPQGGKR